MPTQPSTVPRSPARPGRVGSWGRGFLIPEPSPRRVPARAPPLRHPLRAPWSPAVPRASRRTEVPATLLTEFLNPPEPSAKNNRRAPRSARRAAVSPCQEAGRSGRRHASGLDAASPPVEKGLRVHGQRGGGGTEAPRGALCSPRLSSCPVAGARPQRPQAGPGARHPSLSCVLAPPISSAGAVPRGGHQRALPPPLPGGGSPPLPTAVPRWRLTAGLQVAMGIGK